MDEEQLNDDVRLAIASFFTADELVELLDIDIDEILNIFEDDVLANLERIKEAISYDKDESSSDEGDGIYS